MASLSYYAGGDWMTFPYGKEPRTPKVKVTLATPQLVKFELTETDVSVANSLRRVMMAEVPTMAIEIVNIIDNETVIFDEFLAHRMGLLPLTSHYVGDIPPDFGPSRGFNEYKDCNCFDGCGYCTCEFELDVVNPENKIMNVTHFDITETKKYKREGWTEEQEVKPLPFRDETVDEIEDRRENGVLIAKLKKDQHLRMICQARKGIPKYHAKYMPTATTIYQYQPEIKLRDDLTEQLSLDDKIDFVQSCPRKVFDLDIEDKVYVKNLMDCHFCDECVAKAKVFGKREMVKVRMDPSKFYFTVESVTPNGPRSAIDVVRAGLRILDYKFSLFLRDAYGDEIKEHLPLEPKTKFRGPAPGASASGL
mmetsp:Transcript_137541/g.343189  ORF Transcript_137541/g.343189 Transcript_137541/m.343189 type:complete len:364 (-) Transcript_137541:56-1147(-)|eukprot:CAMPEP_0115237366 /NCGR_PEP_ID=MMETSP0270-20121206/36326_1 /TAXON_ID=71861 /ORGANISM="Scrippsiella trochoidea, Strain CCMP3099" /LENGTH=363 /DNA_ID=CAMNT_0002652251 /DNA_START=45 /DNA_END=1136 /DNA_ORIENTATION=+